MRKMRAVLMAAAVTATASTLFAGSAQAAPERVTGPNCDRLYQLYAGDGYFRAYTDSDCRGELGEDRGNDSNWADGSGAFRGSDNDKASSVLNTGVAGSVDNVLLYQGALGGSNGVGCLSHGELYVDNLTRNFFTGGANANDKISRHAWSSSCTNPWT